MKKGLRPIPEGWSENIHQREEFRKHSYLSDIATGVICGLGAILHPKRFLAKCEFRSFEGGRQSRTTHCRHLFRFSFLSVLLQTVSTAWTPTKAPRR